jgi:hypothetical protein
VRECLHWTLALLIAIKKLGVVYYHSSYLRRGILFVAAAHWRRGCSLTFLGVVSLVLCIESSTAAACCAFYYRHLCAGRFGCAAGGMLLAACGCLLCVLRLCVHAVVGVAPSVLIRLPQFFEQAYRPPAAQRV